MALPNKSDGESLSAAEYNALITYNQYNVKSFGAVGDGVTDDTTAVQAAITAAVAAGSGIYLPPGTFLVSGLTATGSLEIEAADGATIKLKNSSNARLFYISGGTYLTIRGGTWDGNKANNTLVVGGCIEAASPTRVNIQCFVKDSPLDGIKVTGATSGNIQARIDTSNGHAVSIIDSSDLRVDVEVNTCVKSGVIIMPQTQDCEGIKVTGIIRSPATAGTPNIGVYFNSGDSFIVKRSSIQVQVFNAGFVGIFPGGDHNLVVDSTVDGCGSVTAASAHAFWVHDSAYISLVGCVARNGVRSGFAIGKAHAISLTGCISHLNADSGFNFTRDDTASGRYQTTNTNKDVTVTGCQALSNSVGNSNVWPGFYVDGYVNVTVVGCQAHDYQGSQTQSRGLVAAANASTVNLSIIGCDFSSNINGSGLQINDAANQLGSVVGNKTGVYGFEMFGTGAFVGNLRHALTANKTFTFPDVTGTLGVKTTAPATAASAGVEGQWAEDDSFLYICIGANTWKRVAIATW